MRIILAILIGWLLIKMDIWEHLTQILIYIFIGWFIIKSYQALNESLKS